MRSLELGESVFQKGEEVGDHFTDLLVDSVEGAHAPVPHVVHLSRYLMRLSQLGPNI